MTKETGASIIDFDTAAKLRLEGKVRRLTMERDALAQTMRDNHVAMAQIHSAILKLVDARDLSVLDQRLGTLAQQSLGADVLRIHIESLDIPRDSKAIFTAPPGFVARILEDHNERLGPCTVNAAALYGDAAGSMASEALFRINVHGHEGVLALASANRLTFKVDHGTDMASFFTRIIERLVAAWAPR